MPIVYEVGGASGERPSRRQTGKPEPLPDPVVEGGVERRLPGRLTVHVLHALPNRLEREGVVAGERRRLFGEELGAPMSALSPR